MSFEIILAGIDYNVTQSKLDQFFPSSVLNQWAEKMGQLFKSGNLSDLKIIARDNSEFNVHSCLLVTRSDFFAGIVELHSSNTTWNRTIKCEELNNELAQVFLLYIYTNKLPSDMSDIVHELLLIADVYIVNDLKAVCERYMALSIKIENCLALCSTVESHSTEYLKKYLIQFITEKSSILVDHEDWNTSMQQFPNIFQPVISNIAKNSLPFKK